MVPVWKRVAVAIGAVSLAAVAVLWQPHVVAAYSAPNPDPGSAEFYTQKVKPIFESNCFRCHGGVNHRGGLTFDTQAGLLKGGHDGAVVVVGHPEQSLLVKLIRHEGPADDPMPMPPKGDKLSDADIATVSAWIKAGAKMPDAQ
ncbi:c-type cytochrome [Granulicella sp. 5B5]|nr:c-type cytochrome [Granulicella sp. 5B5]